MYTCHVISKENVMICPPLIWQIVGFAERCIKNAGRKFVEGNDDKKKKWWNIIIWYGEGQVFQGHVQWKLRRSHLLKFCAWYSLGSEG